MNRQSQQQGGPAGPLAEKPELLIRHGWPKTVPAPKTNADTAAAIAAATGTELSPTTIWKLRTGRIYDPTLTTLSALARFFDVSLSYFSDEANE